MLLPIYLYKEIQTLNCIKRIFKCNIFPYICIYTGCPRRKGPNSGRLFLRSNYTDINQNTYIQSRMVTEIMAREF